MKVREQGFTLVELIVVIVILGILAATALPRFINVQTDAKVAAVNGIAAGLRSASALVIAKWQAGGGLSSTTAVSMVGGGGDVAITTEGFPTQAGMLNAMGCTTSPCQGVDVSGTDWTPSGGNATCKATYTVTGQTGVVGTATGGC